MANKYHKAEMDRQLEQRETLRDRGISNIIEDPRYRTPAVLNRDVKGFIKKTGGRGK